MQAQDIIHRGDFDFENYESVGDLYLMAFDRPELAQTAKVKAAEAKVKRRTEDAK